MKMKDSGKRQEFESGAVRDTADGKPRPDLQSPYAQERIGHWLRLGAEKYAERNWEQGMSFSRCIASLERHLVAFKMGKYDEDHLAAIAVNAQFLMHYEEMIDLGVLPDTLDDMPHYVPFENEKPQFKKGDGVKIKLRDDAGDALRGICESFNNVGVVRLAPVPDGMVPVHLAGLTRTERYFYPDELTLVKGGDS